MEKAEFRKAVREVLSFVGRPAFADEIERQLDAQDTEIAALKAQLSGGPAPFVPTPGMVQVTAEIVNPGPPIQVAPAPEPTEPPAGTIGSSGGLIGATQPKADA